MRETWVQSLGQEDPLEKEMATHSSFLAWRTPWTEEPGELQSTGSQRVRHDWATSLSLSNFEVCNVVLLTRITVLYIRSPKVIHLLTASLYPLTTIFSVLTPPSTFLNRYPNKAPQSWKEKRKTYSDYRKIVTLFYIFRFIAFI